MKILYFVVVLFAFSSSVYAENPLDGQEQPNNNVELLKEALKTLKLEVDTLNAQIKQLEKKTEADKIDLNSHLVGVEESSRKQFSQLGEELEDTNNQINSVEASVKAISLAWAQSSNLAKLGAIILLTGLLIEIIGATVLAGTHLVTEQKEVYTLKSTPPSKDLSVTDVNSEPRIDFLGSIASFMLFVGFVLQFSGTILVLSLPSWLAVIMVALAIIPGSLVIFYLLGQSYNQSRKQKIKVILKNIRRNLTPSFSTKCEICSKRLKFNESYVFWSKEPSSEQHPYLNPPYNMHLGHKECLESSGKYEAPPNRNVALEKIEQHQKSVAEFLITDAPKMKQWWSEYREYWATKINSEETVNFSEYKFLQLLQEIKKLKPNTYEPSRSQ